MAVSVGDHGPQRGRVARRRQGDPAKVEFEIEARIILPVRAGERLPSLDDPLPKAWVAVDEAGLDDLADGAPVRPLVEPENSRDHHQVRRLVHMEPCGIRVRHLCRRGHVPSVEGDLANDSGRNP